MGGFFRAVRRLGLRALALTIGAMLLLNLAVLVAAGYFESREARRADNENLLSPPILAQTVAAARLLDRLDAAGRADALSAFNSPMLRLRLIDDFSTTPSIVDPKPAFVPILETFRERFGERPFSVYVREGAPRWRFWRGDHASLVDDLIIVLKLEDGKGLVAEPGVGFRRRIARLAFIYVIGAVGLILVGLMTWASVSYAQPLARLAAASARFSRDLDAEPMLEAGPKPVRDLAAALNDMQARLRGLVAERTTVLAAIAHDMRTYLTRLRMRAEFIEDPGQRDRAVRDLEDMTRLLEDALSLGAAEARPAERAPLALGAFLSDLAERRGDADGAARIALRLPAAGDRVVETDAVDLARAVNNLVDNALRYAGAAEIALTSTEGGGVEIAVLDSGPGVPETHLEAMTRPFTRLESSRSRDTGGAGLGLAIAQARAARAGATLALANRPEGGLAARLSFPPERATRGA